MNARPERRFLFRLAGHLGKTVRWICEHMDSRELTEWIVYDRYYEPFGDYWRQTGLMASASLAPYTKAKPPSPQDFMPLDPHAPQHQTQIDAVLRQMQQDLEGDQ